MKTWEQLYNDIYKELNIFTKEISAIAISIADLGQIIRLLPNTFKRELERTDETLAMFEIKYHKYQDKIPTFKKKVDRFPKRYRNKLYKEFRLI